VLNAEAISTRIGASPQAPGIPAVARWIRVLTLASSGLVFVSAVGMVAVDAGIGYILPGQKPSWLLVGFEAVVAVAGFLGVMFGIGRFADGPGLALACIAGTVLMGSALGWLSAAQQVGGYSLTPLLGLRVLAAGMLGFMGACCVLSRDPRAWKPAMWGAGSGLPVLAAIALMLRASSRRAIESALGSWGMLGAAVGLLALVALGVCLCASVHLVVKAFEMGREK
jgi:hypothetical protein